MLAAADEPIAGGRHKVFGHHDLAVIPQTSTIASHLPRALGVAFAIGRARKLGAAIDWPDDAIVVCSFGDASANHSTADGRDQHRRSVAYQHLPLPLLFVCEDNGLGISVRTPPAGSPRAYGHGPGLRYVQRDGADPAAVFDVAAELADWIRARAAAGVPAPAAPCASAATPAPTSRPRYRSADEIRADYGRDPLARHGPPARGGRAWPRPTSWSRAYERRRATVRRAGRGAARRAAR